MTPAILLNVCIIVNVLLLMTLFYNLYRTAKVARWYDEHIEDFSDLQYQNAHLREQNEMYAQFMRDLDKKRQMTDAETLSNFVNGFDLSQH